MTSSSSNYYEDEIKIWKDESQWFLFKEDSTSTTCCSTCTSGTNCLNQCYWSAGGELVQIGIHYTYLKCICQSCNKKFISIYKHAINTYEEIDRHENQHNHAKPF